MESLNNYRKVKIETIFNFPKTNTKVTKKFCNLNHGTIPVYASSSNGKSVLGFIKDNIEGVKYYENCLSWNRNGSVGYVFVRNHRFATNEDHRSLIIKEEYRDQLNKLYLKFEIERQLFLNGFSFLDKCGVDKIKEINILIPINKKNEFDLNKQIELGEKYYKLQKYRLEIDRLFENIMNVKVDISKKLYDTISIPITDLFYIKKGNSKYTKKYIHDHKGKYPVYSSKTSDFGEIGKINSYDYDMECFTWTSDGIHAGTVFYRNNKFSITTHCGILELKPFYNTKVNYEYLYLILNQTLPNYVLGEWANKRLGKERMKEISIDIPIKDNSNFDLDKQIDIAIKYKKINKFKDEFKNDYEKIRNLKVQIL